MADTCFVDTIEVSVRCANVLAREGVKTYSEFMALTKPLVMSWGGAGIRTWREIEALQEVFSGYQPPIEPTWDTFCGLVVQLNEMMEARPEFHTVDAGQGFLTAVRSTVADGQKRLGR